jgi:predicted phage terminase large subunit-like protein
MTGWTFRLRSTRCAMSRKWPKATIKLVEDKANGTAVLAMLKRELPGLIGVDPKGGKIARANAVSALVEAGDVFLPHPQIAPWVDAFVRARSSSPPRFRTGC